MNNAPDGWKLVPICPTREMRAAAGQEESKYVAARATFFAGDSWVAMVEAAPEYVAEAWLGEGLPPVGTVCEWRPNQDGWVQVEILGHNGEETWFRREGHESSETCLRMAFFRPIRAPEQIAAEEREKEIDAMFQIACKPEGVSMKKAIGLIYDAGYRKFEIIDEPKS